MTEGLLARPYDVAQMGCTISNGFLFPFRSRLFQCQMGDYEPSRIRGPPIPGLDARESKKFKQSLSQTLTVKKKYEIRKDQAVYACKATSEAAELLGGAGAVRGAIAMGYPKLTVKGKDLGTNTQYCLEKIWDPQVLATSKTLIRHPDVMPQYNVGDNYTEGQNRSNGGRTPLQLLKVGLKSELPGHFTRNCGLRLNDHATHLINMINQEFFAEFRRMPTEDESKATVQLALLNARENMKDPTKPKIAVSRWYSAP